MLRLLLPLALLLLSCAHADTIAADPVAAPPAVRFTDQHGHALRPGLLAVINLPMQQALLSRCPAGQWDVIEAGNSREWNADLSIAGASGWKDDDGWIVTGLTIPGLHIILLRAGTGLGPTSETLAHELMHVAYLSLTSSQKAAWHTLWPAKRKAYVLPDVYAMTSEEEGLAECWRFFLLAPGYAKTDPEIAAFCLSLTLPKVPAHEGSNIHMKVHAN